MNVKLESPSAFLKQERSLVFSEQWKHKWLLPVPADKIKRTQTMYGFLKLIWNLTIWGFFCPLKRKMRNILWRLISDHSVLDSLGELGEYRIPLMVENVILLRPEEFFTWFSDIFTILGLNLYQYFKQKNGNTSHKSVPANLAKSHRTLKNSIYVSR